jgi:hypothetical protein
MSTGEAAQITATHEVRRFFPASSASCTAQPAGVFERSRPGEGHLALKAVFKMAHGTLYLYCRLRTARRAFLRGASLPARPWCLTLSCCASSERDGQLPPQRAVELQALRCVLADGSRTALACWLEPYFVVPDTRLSLPVGASVTAASSAAAPPRDCKFAALTCSLL